LPATLPATMSEWPLRYFVALLKHRSNPIETGRRFTGVAKVLSITVTSLWRRAKATISRNRPTRISGFVIVSTRIARLGSAGRLPRLGPARIEERVTPAEIGGV